MPQHADVHERRHPAKRLEPLAFRSGSAGRAVPRPRGDDAQPGRPVLASQPAESRLSQVDRTHTSATLFDSTAAMVRQGDLGGLDPLRELAFRASPVAQIVVTGEDTVAMINHQAEKAFGLSARDIGRLLRDLEVSYRPLELRAYLEQAKIERRAARVQDVKWVRARRGHHVVRDSHQPARRHRQRASRCFGRLLRRDGQPAVAGQGRADQPATRGRLRGACSRPTRNWRPPTKNCSRRSRSWRPPTRNCSPRTKSSKR